MYDLLQSFIEPSSLRQTVPNFSAGKAVVYWVTREHRVHDNRALWLAQYWALQANAPLYIAAAFRTDLTKASMLDRTFQFAVRGLQEMEATARSLQIPFIFLQGDPVHELAEFVSQYGVGTVVTDLFPLEPYRTWQTALRERVIAPVLVVDGHNTLPVWRVSPKQEYAARTIRPKIWRLFSDRVGNLPQLSAHPYLPTPFPEPVRWDQVLRSTQTLSGAALELPAGATAGAGALAAFVESRLAGYTEQRNDPARAATSRLSAYLHFGHLSAEQVVSAVQGSSAPMQDVSSFLEEFVVRKELAENYCYYSSGMGYARLDSIPSWAKRSLELHARDARPHLYAYDELEHAQTHDEAWNACQRQMVQTGFMHGYMRMYWAKKLLEWTESPAQALEFAVRLNDLYELDGRDPNGYVGILWAIGGVHDRPWGERPVFGKIRYMNQEGLRRKFAIHEYIKRWSA